MQRNLAVSAYTKMADVIHMDYRLIPILGRFGIEFGFGNGTVAEVCSAHEVNCSFFLEIVNSYHNPEYFPEKQLQRFSVALIIDYLKNTHAYYLHHKVPEIQSYINQMEEGSSSDQQKNIHLLKSFFKEYTEELKDHLSKEDHSVFPYALALHAALESGTIPDSLLQTIREEPILEYERNHDDLEIKLNDLKNLIIKYLPPISNEVCQKLLTELYRLESDLENHARIEEKVLVPKISLIEKELLQFHGAC
jgi:regulator of cell morphogenesis and NO signaling